MQGATIPNYKSKINELMPGAKIIKLTGYANNKTDYQKAKTPVGAWKKVASLTDEQINAWTNKGGWIGTQIPAGFFIVDIDNPEEGEILKDLLEGENVHHHAIKTPNGMQFIFKGETDQTAVQGQYAKFVNRLGLTQDTRVAGKGYIVFPTENTEGRSVVSQSMNELDELPPYLHKAWNGAKTPSPMSYPYESDGSRDNDFFDMARRLMTCGVSKDDTLESLQLAYEYFVLDKDGFPIEDVKKCVNSAYDKTKDNAPVIQQNQTWKLDFAEDDEPDGSIPEILVPAPFLISSGSLLKQEIKRDVVTKKMVSRKVPAITKEFHNIERPQVLYELVWNERFKQVKEIIPASAVAIKKELLELSEKGLSVNENNAKTIIEYLDLYLAHNEIEQQYAVDRLGSVKDRFIHPELTKEIEIMAIDQGEKQLLESFETKGTADTWKEEVFNRIKDQPKAVLFVLASFASVLIKDLRVQPFIVDLSGNTSQGKTTTLRAATSVWGNDGLLNEWNATKVSIERKAAYLNSYPVCMDDTRKADERVLKDIIYQFSGGRSKGRGSVKGSQREFTWHNILLSTGEVSLNEYAKNAGGAAARVIPITDQPLKKDIDNITQLHKGMENNYGAIGIEFLKVWAARKENLIPEYPQFKNHYIGKANGNEVLTRLSGYYAAIHFAGRILKKHFGMEVDLEAISSLFDEIAQENKATDKPKQFLEEILTDLDSSRQDIYYNYEPPVLMKAIYKDEQLFLTPAYLSRFLGAEESGIRREWLKRGITIGKQRKDGSWIDYGSKKHKGKTFRAIPINMEYVQEFGFDFEYVPESEFLD